MHRSTKHLLHRAEKTAKRLRDAGQNDRANRFCGRAEVVIARHCARIGDLLPTLYVTHEPRDPLKCGGSNVDRYWLTTWPGNKVAQLEVTGTAPAFNTRLTCYRATIEGRVYIGRGLGPSMYLNMRPSRRALHYFIMVGGYAFPINNKREQQQARAVLRAKGYKGAAIWCNGQIEKTLSFKAD